MCAASNIKYSEFVALEESQHSASSSKRKRSASLTSHANKLEKGPARKRRRTTTKKTSEQKLDAFLQIMNNTKELERKKAEEHEVIVLDDLFSDDDDRELLRPILNFTRKKESPCKQTRKGSRPQTA
eukprot:TRINITY_DN21222_c0_g1_i1.p2 TRINITY_DN21222_c0_g1~~TRINITY_DN21222_c0_g1_i1.p2  ORF type:complete len:127 (-),score=28.81 TRINITY_DN21222_c0_g1_i1:212-592(-)